MAYNEQLADRLREALQHEASVEEKIMFSGVTFMVDGKMCLSVAHDDLMCRIDPKIFEQELERNGARPMVMKGKTMKGFLKVAPEGYQRQADFDHWVGLSLSYNKEAKASKKKPKF